MSKESPTAPERTVNPNLRPERTDEIIEAVLTELAEVGYGQLSMDGVARRAKAGKSALYRRWPSKQEMILDAVQTISMPSVEIQESQDLHTAVALMVGAVDEWLTSAPNHRILPDLVAEALRNPALDEALTERIGMMRRGYWREVFERRIATGEISEDADIEYALDLLGGPLFWRICGRRRESDQALRDNVIRSILDVLTSDRR